MPLRYHDTTHSPVGLWQFDGTLSDSSGYGNHLSFLSGFAAYERYTDLLPGMRGLDVDFTNDADCILMRWSGTVPAYDSELAITGDLTIEALILTLGSYNGASPNIALFAGSAISEVSDNNILYAFGYTTSSGDDFKFRYDSESGAGVNDFYVADGSSNQGFPSHVAMRRSGQQISFFQNGKQRGATSGVLTTPTDGTAGGFMVGGQWSTGALPVNCGKVVIASLKVIPSALSDAQILDEYEYTLGDLFPRATP